MNQLAIAIRKLYEGQSDPESCQLISSEFNALQLISNMMGMSSADLATYLQLEDDPIEWLIPQMYSAQ
jgi:hypothetical protein